LVRRAIPTDATDPTRETPPVRPGRVANRAVDERYNVEAVGRAIELLLEAARLERPVPLRELVERLGWSKPTVYRLLRTLEAHGALRQSSGGGYVPGPAMITVGQAALRAIEVPAIGHRHLERLHGELGETVNMAILAGDEIVIADRIEDRQILGLRLNVGSRLPAYCTSVGQVLLAGLPDDEIARRLADCRFDPLAPRTLRSIQGILQRVDEVRQRGYAINDEELAVGHRAVAAPVVDHEGNTAVAINVSVPVARVTREELVEQMVEPLLRAARAISEELGAPVAGDNERQLMQVRR
jgi:IclR family transcriptional regulator, pca regulon regulatory protein